MNSQDSSQQLALESMATEGTLINSQEGQTTQQPAPTAVVQTVINDNITEAAATAAAVEMEKEKEREMAELLITMDQYKAIIPNSVIDYYLNKTGFDCDDARIKKLFALAAQKFVADIASDAFQHSKIRQATTKSTTKANKEKKVVLNMDDLSSALNDYGVNIKKPDYYS